MWIFRKIYILVILFSVFYSTNSYSELVNKVNVQGNERIFEENKIKLTFQKFAHPKYPQLHGEFVPNLSILDAIFNIGPEDTLKKLNQK